MINFDSNINRLKSKYYLNKAINEAFVLVESYSNVSKLLLEEEGGPHYEWDLINNKFYDRINNIESDIVKSTSTIKNSEQAIAYLKELLKRITKLPDSVKYRLIKAAIASMLIVMSLQSIINFGDKVEKLNVPDKTSIISIVNDKIESIIHKKSNKKIKIPKTYSSKLIKPIIDHEGKSLKSYDSQDGAYTIGYGHAVFKDLSRGDNSSKYPFLKSYDEYEKMKQNGQDVEITDAQASKLFKDDLKNASDGLNRLLDEWKSKGINPKITQPMYDAMVSMIYNMGIGNFRQSEFIQLVKRSKFKEAAEAIKTTSSQMFDTHEGLIDRRKTESRIFKGDYPT